MSVSTEDDKDCLTHLKAVLALALGAGRRLHLCLCVLEERPDEKPALHTVVFNHLQLREDTRAASHHALDHDQLVEVHVPASRHHFKAANTGLPSQVPENLSPV